MSDSSTISIAANLFCYAGCEHPRFTVTYPAYTPAITFYPGIGINSACDSALTVADADAQSVVINVSGYNLLYSLKGSDAAVIGSSLNHELPLTVMCGTGEPSLGLVFYPKLDPSAPDLHTYRISAPDYSATLSSINADISFYQGLLNSYTVTWGSLGYEDRLAYDEAWLGLNEELIRSQYYVELQGKLNAGSVVFDYDDYNSSVVLVGGSHNASMKLSGVAAVNSRADRWGPLLHPRVGDLVVVSASDLNAGGVCHALDFLEYRYQEHPVESSNATDIYAFAHPVVNILPWSAGSTEAHSTPISVKPQHSLALIKHLMPPYYRDEDRHAWVDHAGRCIYEYVPELTMATMLASFTFPEHSSSDDSSPVAVSGGTTPMVWSIDGLINYRNYPAGVNYRESFGIWTSNRRSDVRLETLKDVTMSNVLWLTPDDPFPSDLLLRLDVSHTTAALESLASPLIYFGPTRVFTQDREGVGRRGEYRVHTPAAMWAAVSRLPQAVGSALSDRLGSGTYIAHTSDYRVTKISSGVAKTTHYGSQILEDERYTVATDSPVTVRVQHSVNDHARSAYLFPSPWPGAEFDGSSYRLLQLLREPLISPEASGSWQSVTSGSSENAQGLVVIPKVISVTTHVTASWSGGDTRTYGPSTGQSGGAPFKYYCGPQISYLCGKPRGSVPVAAHYIKTIPKPGDIYTATAPHILAVIGSDRGWLSRGLLPFSIGVSAYAYVSSKNDEVLHYATAYGESYVDAVEGTDWRGTFKIRGSESSSGVARASRAELYSSTYIRPPERHVAGVSEGISYTVNLSSAGASAYYSEGLGREGYNRDWISPTALVTSEQGERVRWEVKHTEYSMYTSSAIDGGSRYGEVTSKISDTYYNACYNSHPPETSAMVSATSRSLVGVHFESGEWFATVNFRNVTVVTALDAEAAWKYHSIVTMHYISRYYSSRGNSATHSDTYLMPKTTITLTSEYHAGATGYTSEITGDPTTTVVKLGEVYSRARDICSRDFRQARVVEDFITSTLIPIQNQMHSYCELNLSLRSQQCLEFLTKYSAACADFAYPVTVDTAYEVPEFRILTTPYSYSGSYEGVGTKWGVELAITRYNNQTD